MQQPDTSYRAHARAVLALGLPLVGSNLAQVALNVTDAVLLGWYSVTALAGVTLATSFYFIIFIIGAGCAWAVMPLVAAAAEAGDEVQARRVTRMGFWLVSAFGALAVLPLWHSGAIMLAIGQKPEVAQAAQDFLRIASFAMLPALLVTVLRSFLSALQRTSVLLWATVGAAFCNAGLGWVLIFGRFGLPALGIKGAAIATVTIQVLVLVVLAVYTARALPQYRLFQRLWRPDFGAMWAVARMGGPIGLTSLAEGGLFNASAVMMGWVGEVPLAAHGIAIQLASLTFMFHLGMSQAATVRAGRALGRRDEAGLRRGGQVATVISLCFALLTMAVFLAIPQVLVTLFVDSHEPARDALISAGVTLVAVAGLFQVVDAAQVMTLGLLRGVQDTSAPLGLAVISYWLVGVPVSYVLGFHAGLGGVGIWLGLVTGLTVASALLMRRFWRRSVRIGIV
ncbi:MAG: MATE family efflux transporter [Limimaricola sp.]|uniref:MATE family efflux transporter n=1 Tax=Limimaricola sp. TaxID=2211665 RepID=UPI001D75B2CC|nr:MATE family efflux transporter [Limimaricola sp.]MBI1416382.1 MATE family efflux transporter [Limimaricola sp.]